MAVHPNKNNTILYGNGGSGNHGCEAIIRGTAELLGVEPDRLILHSVAPEQDTRYGLGQLAQIHTALSDKKKDIQFVKAYLKMKLTGDFTDMDGLAYLSAIKADVPQSSVALSVGGDNYCYGYTKLYAYLNNAYKKHGMKTVLFGCSIEPDVVAQPAVAKDLSNYDLIVARESITYEAVSETNPNTILAPDPAFFLKPQECVLDPRFNTENVIGINISPMIVSNEQSSGIAYENYRHLIQHILDTTDANIALIPHVVWDSNDDQKVLRRLYEDFDCNERLIQVEDHSAPELKYIISKCSFFVGARTHATIAAYSSCVPTLVVGYSVKARGIARDLFGNEADYVLPVQELTQPEQLTEAFLRLYEQRFDIAQHLKDTLPAYLAVGAAAKKAVEKLM